MFLLYRRSYRSRYEAIAELIAPGASVVDACCGPGTLYTRHLRHKTEHYVGLDLSPAFIFRLRKQGVDARLWDMRSDLPLPHADYVVMQASLYQFLPDPTPVVNRMLAAASEQLIITEPVHNLTSGRPFLQHLSACLTNAGAGPESQRFDERSLDDFFSAYQDWVIRSTKIAGRREKLYLLKGQAGGS